MAKGVGTSAFICLIFLGLFLRSDAAITSWTTPTIASSASGTGTLSVNEDHALNTEIETYVAVTDETTDTSITYSLVSAVAPFAVSAAGELTITAALDRDTEDSYTLEIKAEDSGSAVGTATITVTVTVNEAPSFAKTTSGKRISKDSAIGTTIMTVTATDPDDGDVLKYSIHSGDTNSDFTIDEASGLIKTANVITGTTMDVYTLVIHAVDDDATSKKTGTTTVVVLVEDCTCSGAASVTAGLVLVLAGLLQFLY